MEGWGLLLSGIYLSLIFEFFKTSIYFPWEIVCLTGLQVSVGDGTTPTAHSWACAWHVKPVAAVRL